MNKQKKQYYAVVHGRNPGIYNKWFGEDGAADQVENFPEALYKGFYTKEEAIQWLRELGQETLLTYAPGLLELIESSIHLKTIDIYDELLKADRVVIHTDGCALGNPGTGGFATILRFKDRKKEISGGFEETTNNRMELIACIEGLKALKQKCSAVVFSDSKYLVDAMANGWALKWRANRWMKDRSHKVSNADLWAKLLELCEQHEVEFRWVRGHNLDKTNERCDFLAKLAAKKPNLNADEGFNRDELQSPLFSN